MEGMRLEATSDIQEVKVLGDWAWLRNRLHVTVTPPDGPAATFAGYVLTILQKQTNGAWVVVRDANMLLPIE
jgi:uncharacterized protein (TIGR02246 family)